MRIFVFEFITGGGWFLADPVSPPTGGLLREGRAMAEAIVEDFTAIDGVETVRLVDARLGVQQSSGSESISIQSADELTEQFTVAAASADFTLVIAPEIDDHLRNFAKAVLNAGGALLGPSPEFIRLASNKHRTAQSLANARILTPIGRLHSPGKTLPSDFPFPAALKPIDGAGSLNIQRIENVAQLSAIDLSSSMRLEQYHPGVPVSVAAIRGRSGFTLLPPCLQSISDTGDFSYLGGECPIDATLAERAIRLAHGTVRVLPPAKGYIGIDMVLGDNPSGKDDVVIEVNPRLTTSYVGLRKLVRENLAAAMLSAARGEPIELSTHAQRVEFAADGTVRTLVE